MNMTTATPALTIRTADDVTVHLPGHDMYTSLYDAREAARWATAEAMWWSGVRDAIERELTERDAAARAAASLKKARVVAHWMPGGMETQREFASMAEALEAADDARRNPWQTIGPLIFPPGATRGYRL